MENNRCSSNKKCLSSGEEKLIREVDYDVVAGSIPLSATPSINLEILQKVRRVLISIKPTTNAVKTLFIANKSLDSTKGSGISVSRLGTGDCTSQRTRFSDAAESNVTAGSLYRRSASEKLSQLSESTDVSISSITIEPKENNKSNTKHRHRHTKDSYEKCYIYIQPMSAMGPLTVDTISEKPFEKPIKADTVIIVTDPSSKDLNKKNNQDYDYLRQRLNHIEKKVLQQEMVIRCMDSNSLSTGEEEGKGRSEESTCEAGRPGCSYIEQYSHIPETSAFHRSQQPVLPRDRPGADIGHQSTATHTQAKYEEAAHSSNCSHLKAQRQLRSAPLTPDQTATIEKGHNSEQYGRHFTTYDGITARGKRHSASVPVKRVEVSTMAAERVQRIRQKLNPVRDYRLMDTVHYLAQGEFAPRDDGIKLTPSREAVLSDIVWEDVCRTHWPNARLNRRNDRNGRGELQRQIDNLLRERVAHVERRRRRHYKIIKLNNHRHDNCKPVGKTGDIIVASHKNNSEIDSLDTTADGNRNPRNMHSNGSERRRIEPMVVRKTHNSHDQLQKDETTEWNTLNRSEGAPGPSSIPKGAKNREASCYFHTYKPKPALNSSAAQSNAVAEPTHDESSPFVSAGRTSCGNEHKKTKLARMVMKRDISRRKHREDTNLDHFILLPTLVARTPSNIMRQKKFNALYHRILKIHIQNKTESANDTATVNTSTSQSRQGKKDIGCNINITLSDNED